MKKLTIFLLVCLILCLGFIFFITSGTQSDHRKIESMIMPEGNVYYYENCKFLKTLPFSFRETGEVVTKDNVVLCKPSNP